MRYYATLPPRLVVVGSVPSHVSSGFISGIVREKGYKMDALLAMQNLLRLRALIRDSPLSSGDVFGTKELHPGEQQRIHIRKRLLTVQQVVQSPVAELATQDTRFPPS